MWLSRKIEFTNFIKYIINSEYVLTFMIISRNVKFSATANEGYIIEACGLNGNYKREEFNVISQLIPLVEDITYKTAICRETGQEASFTKLRDATYKEIEVIGGEELYSAVDRQTYFLS